MEPAQHSLAGAGQVVLDERTLDAMSGISNSLICLHKKTTTVPGDNRLDQQDARNLGNDDFHEKECFAETAVGGNEDRSITNSPAVG